MSKGKTARRQLRKWKRRKVRKSVIPSTVALPKTQYVRMRYVDSILISGSTGVIGTQKFKLNSLYDPDQTGTGHQPMGRDQWEVLYRRYGVVGVKATLRWNFATGTSPIEVGGFVSPLVSLTATSFSEIDEQGTAKSSTLSASSAYPYLTTKHYFSAKKFFNIRDMKDNMSDVGQYFGSDPSRIAYLHLFAQAADLTSSISVRVHVTLDYVVMLAEPKELPQS